jgi:hypothetical protein
MFRFRWEMFHIVSFVAVEFTYTYFFDAALYWWALILLVRRFLTRGSTQRPVTSQHSALWFAVILRYRINYAADIAPLNHPQRPAASLSCGNLYLASCLVQVPLLGNYRQEPLLPGRETNGVHYARLRLCPTSCPYPCNLQCDPQIISSEWNTPQIQRTSCRIL